MLGIVGYFRTIAALALMLSSPAEATEPAEPLTVTRLPDGEKLLVTSAASDRTPENDTGQFSRAVSDAVRAQQQSMQANCQAVPTASSPIAARWAWEARCRYKRY
jgi:hypothetical protein